MLKLTKIHIYIAFMNNEWLHSKVKPDLNDAQCITNQNSESLKDHAHL